MVSNLKNDHSWLSIHCFVDSDNNEKAICFLIPHILVALNKSNILIRKYFFIRYPYPTFHIRIRLEIMEIDYHRAKQIVEQSLLACMTTYSFLTRFIFKSYLPELKRYGGRYGVSICEKQFFLSSKTVLNHIARSNEWNYKLALGYAVQMHISLVYAFEIKNAITFFNDLTNKWIKFVVRQDITDNLPKRKEYFFDLFEEKYSNNKGTLIPFIESFIVKVKKKHTLSKNTWLYNWLSQHILLKKELFFLNKKGCIEVDKMFFLKKGANDLAYLHSLLDSLIHMTNNRLGIFNEDEPYITYIIRKTLIEIKDCNE